MKDSSKTEEQLKEELTRLQKELSELKEAGSGLKLCNAVVNSMAEGLYIAGNTDGKILFANPRCEEIFGYASGEMAGEPVSAISASAEKSRDESTKEIKAALKKEGVWSGEIISTRKDGTPFWCSVNVSTFNHPEYGSVIITACSDITERRERAEAVWQGRYYKLMERSNDAVFLSDAVTGVIIYANQKAEKLTCRTAEELVGMPISGLYPEDMEQEFASLFKGHIEKNTGRPVELLVRRGNGNDTPVELLANITEIGGRKVIVSNLRNIAARRLFEDELKRSSSLLIESQKVARLGTYVFDIKTGTWSSSVILDTLFGIDPHYRKDVIGWLAIVHPDERATMHDYLLKTVIADNSLFDKEYRVIRKDDKEERWVHGLGRLEFDSSGKGVRIIGTVQDITEHKCVQEQLRKTNRLYSTLSQFNQAIVRERDQDRLFQMICNIAIEYGEFRLAWIGLIDEETRQVTPVAFSGEGSDYLQGVSISLSDEITAKGPTGQSILKGKSVVFNDLENNPDYAPWREHAVAKGYRSSAAFPIHLDDKVIGALNIYAVEPHFFDEAEIKLLDEAALDISFALKIFKEEARRRRAESVNIELGRLLEDSLNEIYVFNSTTMKFFHVNAGACRNLGYTVEELADLSPVDIKPEISLDSFLKLLAPIRTGKKEAVQFETLHQRKDGSTYPVEVHIQASTYSSAPAYVAIVLDITERKKAETEARNESEITRNLLRLARVSAKTADIDRLMEGVVGITRDIIGSDSVISYIWNKGTGSLRPGYAAGLSRGMTALFKATPLGLNSTIMEGTMKSGRVFVDSGTDGTGLFKLQQEGLFNWVKKAGTIALLPIVGRRRYLGLIACVCFKDPGGNSGCLSDKTRVLMQAIAEQVSTALEEAFHHKESLLRAMELSRKVETIETMSEISKSILSTLDVDEIFEVTARMVSRLLTCDLVRVIEVDRTKEVFRFKAGFEEGGMLESMTTPFTSTSLTEVISTKRPQYLADLKQVVSPLEVEKDLLKRGYRSVLRIPVIVKGEVTGVLGLMSRRTSAFVPEDFSILDKLTDQVGVALENARLVTGLEELSIGTVMALAATIDAKSPWTRGHSERVTEIALQIGAEIGFSEEELMEFKIAGLLHDIGKIGTNESILDKSGRLTEDEFMEIRKHPGKGAQILTPIKQLTRILPTIRGHHEFYDGTGYPDELKGAEIPLQARILAVADTVDAMGADRPYRDGLPDEKISAELKRCSGTQFDPEVVNAYLRTLERKSNIPFA